jgi:hypothetical protein
MEFQRKGKKEKEMYFLALSFIMYGTSFISSSSVRVKTKKYTKLCGSEEGVVVQTRFLLLQEYSKTTTWR